MLRHRQLGRHAAVFHVAILFTWPVEGGAQPSDVIAAQVDSVFSAWKGTDRPGCAVGASQRGRIVLQRAYGMADVESRIPMTAATPVHAASVAKQITAFAVLQLARDGRLSLDDDVRRHLPELPDYEAKYGTPITIRNLLTHTSGLRDFFEMLILARGQFEEERITSAQAIAAVLRQGALNFSPGTEYGYTNSGYLIAARIVERVSGKRFGQFVESRIFRPRGMTNSRIRDDIDVVLPGRAVGYAREGTGWRRSFPNFDVTGSTNLETTVGDLLRWGETLETAGSDSALVRQMLTPAVLVNGDTTTYGLGISLVRDRGLEVAEHAGRDPGFRAYAGRYIDPKLSVAILCNAAALDPVRLGHDVARLVLGLSTPPASVTPVTTLPSSASHKALGWAGVYIEPSTRQVAELTVRDGVLYTDRRGGSRIEALGPRRARLVGVPLELEFEPGVKLAYIVRWQVPGRRADRFEWRAAAAPVLSRTDLSEYQGAYYSSDLEAGYRIEAGDSTLSLKARAGPGLDARPVFKDAFVSGEYTIQFFRREGKVAGFEISHPRARGMAFDRR